MADTFLYIRQPLFPAKIAPLRTVVLMALLFESLGPLEQRLMSALRQRGSATVADLAGDSENLAYTTIAKTLDRLHKKGIVDRRFEGRRRRFRYSPHQSQEELIRDASGEVVSRVLGLGENRRAALDFLVEAIAQRDARLLAELQQLVERKRRQLEKQQRR